MSLTAIIVVVGLALVAALTLVTSELGKVRAERDNAIKNLKESKRINEARTHHYVDRPAARMCADD